MKPAKHSPLSWSAAGENLVLLALAMLLAAAVVAWNVCGVSESNIVDIFEFRKALSFRPATADAPLAWIDDWFWHEGAPFKYRILGKGLVWCVYQVGLALHAPPESAFYRAYLLSCLIGLWLALCLLGVFLRTFISALDSPPASGRQLGLISCGLLLFTASPPILLFSKLAVHGGPNDFLGYGLMLLTLHLAWTERFVAATLVAAIAASCRETCLLAPFIILFFRQVPMMARVAISAAPIAVFVLSRIAWPGSYDPLEGASLNFEMPLQTLAFFYLTFGPLWVLGVLGYRLLRQAEAGRVQEPLRAMAASFPAAAILTFLVTLVFARIREIRILFVLSIYFIPFSVLWLHSCQARLGALVRTPYFALWALIAAVLSLRMRVWLLPESIEGGLRMESLLGVIFTGRIGDTRFSWVTVTVVYLFLLLVCAPLMALGGRAGSSQQAV